MALSQDEAVNQARFVKGLYTAERRRLDTVRRYWKGRQALPAVIPNSSPREVKAMARMARVNVCPIVVDTLAQATFVDGFRGKNDAADLEVWKAWQANRWDKRQTGIHRATFAYGAAYAVVLPGDLNGEKIPVMRGVSPRLMTAVYGDDPDWPELALEYRGGKLWRLYDATSVYHLRGNNRESTFDLVSIEEHGCPLGVTPVVRYLDEEDLDAELDVEGDARSYMQGHDDPMGGQVAPLMTLQDQIDMTTFSLLVAQWYSAFRQRYAIGWVPEDEAERAKASAAQLWTFDEDPENMKLGEFDQTNLDGYIKSREASLKHVATLSQTPVHELIGELVNLSAEALAAAEAGHDRKVGERKTGLGESHEQTFQLVGSYMGVEVPEDAQVVWRDTSARAFAAVVDGLGKLAQLLGVPRQELWERIPGVTKQDVDRWKAEAESGDAFANLANLLDGQATDTPPTDGA